MARPQAFFKRQACCKRLANSAELGGKKEEDWVERVMGIEPTLFAWEAKVLPLNYTRRGAENCPAWGVLVSGF